MWKKGVGDFWGNECGKKGLETFPTPSAVQGRGLQSRDGQGGNEGVGTRKGR